MEVVGHYGMVNTPFNPHEEAPMKNPRLSLIATGLSVLITGSLQAEDSIFSVGAFIAGIDGYGFLGDEKTGEGLEWEFPSSNGNGGSYYVHSVDDTPLQLEDSVSSDINDGASYGLGQCEALVTESGVVLDASSLCFSDAGEIGEYAHTYVQVHGEFHIHLEEDAILQYDLCNEFFGSTTGWSQLYIRKLVSGNWSSMIQQISSANGGSACSQGEMEIEAGWYQLYFSAYNTAAHHGEEEWALGENKAEATVNFLPLPNIADINGDGVVDGADLARVLGAWGTSSPGGDLNGDGIVNGADLSILLAFWGKVTPQQAVADLNGDGVVNSADLQILLDDWGPCS